MRLKKRYFLLPFLAIFFGYMLFAIYDEVREKTIDEFNAQQTILAKQASKGIENFFNYYLRSLTHFSKMDDVVNFNDIGKSLMGSYYHTHSDVISAMTRINKSGRITYTVPFNKKAIGADISYQKHMKTIIQKQQPVISDVFEAVQGYQAVAYHVPVFSNDIFQGTIAILIPFDNLAKEYIENIKLGKSGYAWVISAGGIEIYNPGSNRIGKTIFDKYGLSPSMTKMIKEMMKERKGITTYSYDRVKSKSVERIKKHAVYLPIRLANTFWSIVVATPEEEVFPTMIGFRNKLFLIAALLIATGLFYSYYFISAWAILHEGTKRKKVEKALLESENKFRSFAEQSFVGIYLIQDGKFVYVNPKHANIFGYTVEECLNNMHFHVLVHPDDLKLVEEQVRRRVAGEIPFVQYEFRGIKKNGEMIHVEIYGSSTFYKGSVAVSGTMLDITERKQADEALKESEKKYRQIYDNILDVYYEANIDGIILEISPSIEKYSQYKREELIGKSLYDVYTNPEERNKLIEALINDGSVNEHELNLTDKDKTQHICSINSMLIKDKNGNPTKIVGIMRDISNRKKAEKEKMELEEKLFRSQKMESLGLLAGGVAHDLNNVLSGIVSYPELILMDLPEDSKFRNPIETMQESGHRAAAIVQDLLTVARGVATTKEVLSLNDLIGDYLNSPELNKLKQFHPTVTVKTNLDTNLLNVNGSHVHIRKVMMNLVSNASEAIEGSGNVTISTTNRYVDRPLKGYDDVNIGEYVVLSVSDDGQGISSDDLERIFEPFYTKKVMGRSGTGLGLAVVWNTVQDHKGYIDVTSGENGTTFELYFPITRDEISDKDLSIPLKDYKGNQETILVVDDMENQREISCKMLDKLGYKTKAVSSGEKAVEYLKENSVDLIMLDMIMDPGINGRETYERIIKIHPKQKAIIISGFAQTDEVKKTQKLGAGRYIKKPITLEKIGIAVKKELEK